MGTGEISRSCFLGLLLGVGAWGLLHSICRLLGTHEPWYILPIFAVLGTAACVGFKIVQLRLLRKDYDKMVNERQRRLH
jgi:hypothetical protein